MSLVLNSASSLMAFSACSSGKANSADSDDGTRLTSPSTPVFFHGFGTRVRRRFTSDCMATRASAARIAAPDSTTPISSAPVGSTNDVIPAPAMYSFAEAQSTQLIVS